MVTVEILVDGAWADITPRVMTRDGSYKVDVAVGRSGESATINPGTCSFQLNNRDGLFSPRNPVSPYYGKIGRNTKVRVSVPNGGAQSYRFQGEIAAWPQNWDTTGTDVWVDVEAAGILRRLNQGSAPLRSTMYRGLTAPSVLATNPLLAYWPCEDAAGSTSIASAMSGGTPMRIVGTPTLASFDGFASSASLPVMGDASFIGTVSSYPQTGDFQVRFLMAVPSTGATTGQVICRIIDAGIGRLDLTYTTGGSLTLTNYGTDGSVLNTLGPFAFGVDGQLVRVDIEANFTVMVGGIPPNLGTPQTTVTVATLVPGATSGSTVSATWATLSTQVKNVTMAPDGGLVDTAIGHVSVQGAITSIFDLGGQLAAYDGETAGNRAARLITEQGIPNGNIGTLSDSAVMGPQTRDTLLNLLQECETTDLGLLFERWTTFGLGYRVRTSLYNQQPGLKLDYAQSQLAAVPTPVDDDQATRNDITVTRSGGSSARATLDTGPLSTLDPPNGVGIYDTAVTVNVQSDDDLPDQAEWRLHMGTVDEARYPQITINLAHPSFTSSATQRSDALGLHPGDRVTIANLPAWMPPGLVSLIVLGVSETIDNFQHVITLNCAPESPYRVGVADDPVLGRADTDGSSLAAAVTATATTLSVATTSGPLWTTDPTDTPFDIAAGGEVMTVTTVGQVLNSNPSFDTNIAGWSAFGGGTLVWAFGASRGSGVARLTTGAASGPGFSATQVTGITPGAQYRALGWILANAALPAGVAINVNWFDSASTYLSTSNNSRVPTVSTWELWDAVFTAPANAARASILLSCGGTPGAGINVFGDDIKLIPVASYDGSPQALNGNPGFEVDTSGWTATSATLTRSTAQAKLGAASGLLTVTNSTNPRAEATQVPTTAGAQYRATGWLYAPAALASGASVSINWFDSSHGYLSTSSASSVPTVGAWELRDTTFTAPAGSAYASIFFQPSGSPAIGAQLYGDDIKLLPVGATSPQTMTVVRSVNGIAKAQTSGTDVRLAQPMIAAL